MNFGCPCDDHPVFVVTDVNEIVIFGRKQICIPSKDKTGKQKRSERTYYALESILNALTISQEHNATDEASPRLLDLRGFGFLTSF
jgi:hypothetical protein